MFSHHLQEGGPEGSAKSLYTAPPDLSSDVEIDESKVIGRGETGIFCRGVQRSTERELAIKLLWESAPETPQERELCLRETGAFELGDDEHILRVLGSGLWRGRRFFAMETFEGETLAHYLQDGHRFTTEEILRVGEGVARALQTAWGAGLIHGAIRPSGIVLTSEGMVKLTGFGTIRTLERSTASATCPETLRYLPPEQILGESLTTRSDLYALGIVLYELATGKTPFDGFESPTSLLYQVSHVDPVPARQLGAMIPPELDRMILRCLDKAPGNRSSSPESFLEGLAGVRESIRRREEAAIRADDLGDFEVFEDQLIGEGGMGTLYRGRQKTLDRVVAIKVIRGIYTTNPEFVQRFRREGELLAQVNDPGVVQIFGTGTWKGRLFYAMELVEGEDLAASLNRGQTFEPDEVLDIAEGVACALRAAWSFKIVHRDIKPSNILRTPDGRVKVADFGLAKSLRMPRTDSQLIAGTAEYLSPEQAVGLKVDIRADIYSLGVVLYELVAGRPPFRADRSSTGVIYQHVHHPPPPLDEVVPDVPEPLAAMIHRCLIKEAGGRFKDPDDFIEEIHRVRGLLQASPPASSLKSLPRKLRRGLRKAWSHPRRLAAGRVALAVLVVVLVAMAFALPAVLKENRRGWNVSPARKSFDLALDLGDFAAARAIAERDWGRESREYREVDRLERLARTFDREQTARAFVLREDWEGASAAFRALQTEAAAPDRDRYAHAGEYCRTLARGRELEKQGARDAALAVYRSLLSQGSLYERYLRERVKALEQQSR